MLLRALLSALLGFASGLLNAAAAEDRGVPIEFTLPIEGPLPKTYRVTLAIVDAKDPDWIISQFACGVARTVTKENAGKFIERWDGLDDNFMPVPPGTYAVKGIIMPARQWEVDGEWHSVTPRFVTGASAWMPSPKDWRAGVPFGGDPVNAPLGDVAVGPNGVAVFYYRYLENGTNNPMVDLTKPGPGQFLRAFPSGGAGGGSVTATDGETVWSYCDEGGPKYVYRGDGKSFGKSEGAQRTNAYLPEGWVTSMAAWRSGAKSFVAVAQRGKVVPGAGKKSFVESPTERIDKVTFHDGENGVVLGELSLSRPQSLAVQGSTLFALHARGEGFVVSSVEIKDGLPQGAWKEVFAVDPKITPFDMEVDSARRIYLSDERANHVYQFGPDRMAMRVIGRSDRQAPGAYDPLTLMAPGKMATWVDAAGNDRILIVENAGPNRVAEWSADGRLLREFLTLQTKANDGYCIDPENPQHVYIPGQQDWLTRFRVDYEKRSWVVDAVWPLRDDPRAPELKKPKLLRANGRMYLAGTAGGRHNAYNVYRHADDGWHLSASILRLQSEAKQPVRYAFWHDGNNNGAVEDAEMTSTEAPGSVFTYQEQNWSDDFAFLAMNQGGQDVWQVKPDRFDTHGNPVFTKWEKVLTDPVFVARKEGTSYAVHGGNELSEKFVSDWMQTDGTAAAGYYVQARGGKNFSANEGAQHKISRYVPDGKGGYRLKWRTGRTALQGVAKPGEMYGGMRVQSPINGLVSVVDQSRCGILLYTDDGLYVDTIFPDGRSFSKKNAGIYPQPGEFFAGTLVPNQTSGKILIAMGKYTPLIYETEGWSLKENPARPLTTLSKSVTISASQIATPPEMALALRGGAGSARFARFVPALGDVAFDGSLAGWESAEPARFEASKDQAVEVRCLYDPGHIYLRWHARLPAKFEAKPLPPLERIFTHDQLADTLSFYIQGDEMAKPSGKAEGRPGDARFVFGIFANDGKMEPVAVGMYPHWTGKTKAAPQTYRTPVGSASFAHVGAVKGAKLAHQIDADGKGFVLVASIPREAIPGLPALAGGLRTLANFEATLGGHSKFWWANSDGSASRETYDEPSEARLYPGSWAPIEFVGLGSGVVVRNWQIVGPFGGPGFKAFNWNPNGYVRGTKKDQKEAARELCDAAKYPPDDGVDLQAKFAGEMIKGYWPDNRSIGWKPATLADLDTRVTLGQAVQVWYGATWIHAPAASEVEFQFQGHRQTYLRWFLNGETLSVPANAYQRETDDARPIARKTVTLRQGWNQVMFRGFCVGYSPFRAGLVVGASEDTLWKLSFSSKPPAP